MDTLEKIYPTKKEFLYTLKFPDEDVIKNQQEKELRLHSINRAMRLGNVVKNKVRIYFRDSLDRVIFVYTTVWGVTKNDVILKKGVTLPIKRIIHVD
ncbi:hypothetical protein GCM10011344_20010 [Dokdonia pacifica]|uniref:Uncharacterized protein n=1 Tax=Dokdonia pacifica TaxID=1627892 RepID=A0A238VNY8_9FLAO|nr:hypothetical protein [Dokdonia pacifica]GGG19354.1 hypothetical protein GCM10011344_20010 [Dokdonia pacifica]SNR36065.1 hypothetical protein SAMN06265376_101132 [Dokdonia pacifica]